MVREQGTALEATCAGHQHRAYQNLLSQILVAMPDYTSLDQVGTLLSTFHLLLASNN